MKPWKVASLILIALAVAAVGYGSILVRRGFSALATPSAIEEFAATTARKIAVPSASRQLRNPIVPSTENIRGGIEHSSYHCRPDPEDEYRESELHAHAEGHVAQLSPPLRKAFELRVLDGLTANEAARTAGMAERTPKFRASYEAAQTTERFPRQATTTGLPRSRGSSRCSTDAWYKNSGWSGAQRSFKKGVCI